MDSGIWDAMLRCLSASTPPTVPMIADRPPIIERGPPPPPTPRRGKRREGRRGTRCLNCYTPTTSRYCHECGQENVAVNIGLWEIFREAIEEFVRFDSKLIRTLIPVILQPGRLTREWAAGRRTTFLSPLKLYLTVTAIFFLILPQLALRKDGQSATENNIIVTSGSAQVFTKEDIERNVRDVPVLIRYPVAQLMKLGNLGKPDGQELRERLIQQVVEHFPTALFAMLPLYAAVLWVLYIRNGRYYVEHLVFALHCHAFYFVLLTFALLVKAGLGGIPAILVNVAAAIWIPIYSFAALKRAYGQGWIKTSVKWFMLGFSYMVLLGFAMLASLVMAAADMPDAPSAAAKPANKATGNTPAKKDASKTKPAPKAPAAPKKSSPPDDSIDFEGLDAN